MSAAGAVQFWDTSALVALVFVEPHTPAASQAWAAAELRFAWDWLRVEAAAAVRRRDAAAPNTKALRSLLAGFQHVALDAGDYSAIERLIDKHGLRAADAGHLLALLQARRLRSELSFVCFDRELARAARAEGVRVVG